MDRLRRTPTVLPPRSDRRFGAGVGLSAAVHVGAIVLLVLGGSALGAYAGDGIGPGSVGGGGGGGSGRVRYIELPPAPTSAPEARAQEAAEDALTLPEPDVARLPPESAALEIPRQARRVVVIEREGDGSGSGQGPGGGSGSGGGLGSGQGTGIGSHSGPGTGGGGAVLAPEPRAVLYPFEEAPPSIKGRRFTLHFWVDRRGRVTRVEVEPAIADAGFRNALLDRLRQWVFYPARTAEGRPMQGELLVPYTP
jgi:protein TonB